MAFGGADQLHEAGFRPVNEFLIRQNNAKGISHIEKNGLDRGSHGRFLLMMMKIAGCGSAGRIAVQKRCAAAFCSQTFTGFSAFILRERHLFVNIANAKASGVFLLYRPKHVKIVWGY